LRPKLLLATNNQGKMREYRELLSDAAFDLILPAAAGINVIVDETGATFEDNARLKATALAGKSDMLVLADDSGLEVDALGGEPGVRSARYAGENASDTQRVEFLLTKLKGIPWEKRTARFRCVIAIAEPGGNVEFCSGDCAGLITFEPFGENGFGYDPVFYLPEFGKTMAELSPAEKNRISHRGQAARKAAEILKQRL
jgi:XTP/dITP diphosphohydrolase